MNIVEGGTVGNFPKKHDPAGKHLNQIKRERGKTQGEAGRKFSRCHEETMRCQHHDFAATKNCCRKTFPEDEPRALTPQPQGWGSEAHTALRSVHLAQSAHRGQHSSAERRPFGYQRGASAQNQAGEALLQVILRLRRRSAESASPPEKLLDPGRLAVNIFSFLSPLNLSVSAGRPANRWI